MMPNHGAQYAISIDSGSATNPRTRPSISCVAQHAAAGWTVETWLKSLSTKVPPRRRPTAVIPMPLKMRPTGLGHGVYKDNVDYGIFCGEWCIGRIYETRTGPADLRWFWALHAPSKAR
jgi:hypothetical protein